MPEDQRAALVDRLRGRLLADARPDGWGYYAGRAARIEPTSWALLALGENWTGPGSWVDAARPRFAFLRSRQTPGGLLSDTEPSLASLAANGLAAGMLRLPAFARATIVVASSYWQMVKEMTALRMSASG